MKPNIDDIVKLSQTKMPFGKFKGCFLIDLPEHYVVWFHNQGLPKGELGSLLAQLYDIKLNGLEPLVKSMIKKLQILD